MKVDAGVKDVRDVVKSGNLDIAERLRYLFETRQDISVVITAKAGENVVVEINDPKPEGQTEEPKKVESAKAKGK